MNLAFRSFFGWSGSYIINGSVKVERWIERINKSLRLLEHVHLRERPERARNGDSVSQSLCSPEAGVGTRERVGFELTYRLLRFFFLAAALPPCVGVGVLAISSAV